MYSHFSITKPSLFNTDQQPLLAWTLLADGLALTIPALFLLGARHAFDADHLAALTSLVSKRRQNTVDAVGIGGAFAFGHFLSAVTFGAIGWVLGVSIEQLTPAVLEKFAGIIAGVITIVLGFWIVKGCVSGQCYHKRSGYRMIDWRLPQVDVPNNFVFQAPVLGFFSSVMYRAAYKVLFACSICLSNWVGLLYSVSPPVPAILAFTAAAIISGFVYAVGLALSYGLGILVAMSLIGATEGHILEYVWKHDSKSHDRILGVLGITVIVLGAYFLASEVLELPKLWEHT